MKTTTLAGAALVGMLIASMPVAAQTTGYALLTADGQLSFAIDGRVQDAAPPLPIQGLEAGDVPVAIDVRPQNGRLYALAHNPKLGTVRLYYLDTAGSAVIARGVGTSGSFVDGGGSPLPIFAQAFGIDFNPSVDRLRVVASNGLNFRINPNNGALVDGNLNITANPPAGVNPDANINGGGGGAMATAYSNNAINVSVTTQYTLDHNSNMLYIQNPPNAGTLVSPLAVTVAGAPLDFGASGGLDIEPGINAASSGAGAVGQAAAVLSVGGQSRLYRIDLATGAAVAQGALGGINVIDLAVFALPPTASALSLSGTQLVRFALAAPGAAASANITGVVAGERLVGIDQRPATGQLYALGIDGANDRGTVYLLEPQSAAGTAVATPVGTPGRIAYFDVNGVPIDLSELPAGVDFNPTVDRIRIVDASGLNARANPNDGAPVDGDATAALVNPDGFIMADQGTQLVGTAYTSNTAVAAFTTQYTLDQFAARLYIQNPPNAGTQTLPLALTIAGAPFEFRGETGFDIPPGPTSTAASAATAGLGYFTADNPAGAAALYEIELADATVRALGVVTSGGQSLTGLAAYAAPIAVGFLANTQSVDETSAPAVVTIVLLNGGSAPVHYRTVDGTAIAGTDYTATQGTLLLTGANRRPTIQIPILTDAVSEPLETFTLELSGPFPGPVTLTITIVDRGDSIFQNGFE